MAGDVTYYAAADGTVPAIDFLADCPVKVAANLLAVLDAVATAPPPQYSRGGKWEAMHGAMGGFHEVRATGPERSARVAQDAPVTFYVRDGPDVLDALRDEWR